MLNSISNKPNFIWLASYPRSGNTMLRTVLWHCFGLHSASLYPNDLGRRKELENYVGHIEHGLDHKIHFPRGSLPLIKTHERPFDSRPAIYIVRDGRAASISLWEFYHRKIPMEAIIAGQHRFGTWSNHLIAWNPWDRPHTLLIKYEEVVDDLPSVLDKVMKFSGHKIITREIPDRKTLAGVDGRWIRTGSDWRSKITDSQLELFNETNKEMLERMGYVS